MEVHRLFNWQMTLPPSPMPRCPPATYVKIDEVVSFPGGVSTPVLFWADRGCGGLLWVSGLVVQGRRELLTPSAPSRSCPLSLLSPPPCDSSSLRSVSAGEVLGLDRFAVVRSDGGIVVSIAAFQAVDPGSIPGHRICAFDIKN